MAEQTFDGIVIADEIEVRFPVGGTVSTVHGTSGQRIDKGAILARLSPTIAQKELDRVLAQYEKIRAQFELFKLKYPTDTDDTIKYNRTIVQKELDRSVLDIELAKATLDSLALISPVNGIIMSDGGLRSGLVITPASHSFTILDRDSQRLQIDVPEDKRKEFDEPRRAVVRRNEKTYEGRSRVVIPNGKRYTLDIDYDDHGDHVVGLTTTVTLYW